MSERVSETDGSRYVPTMRFSACSISLRVAAALMVGEWLVGWVDGKWMIGLVGGRAKGVGDGGGGGGDGDTCVSGC